MKALSEEQLQKIIEAISNGESVDNCLRIHGITWWTFLENVETVPLLAKKYARALELRTEKFVDEIVDIADNAVDPQKARNQIDARKWVAAKMQPHKYGERLDLNVTQNIDYKSVLAQLDARVRSVYEISQTGCEPAEKPSDDKNDLDELLS